MKNVRKTFASNLKRLRKRKKLTQEELAERLGITARYVQRLEGHNCPNVKIDSIAALAKATGSKMSEFLEESPGMLNTKDRKPNR